MLFSCCCNSSYCCENESLSSMKRCSIYGLYRGFYVHVCWFALNLSIMFKRAHFKPCRSYRAIFSCSNGCCLMEILAGGIAACSIQLLLWQVSPIQLSSSTLSMTTPPPQHSRDCFYVRLECRVFILFFPVSFLTNKNRFVLTGCNELHIKLPTSN